MIRLGDGTPLSRDKMQAALGAIWPLVDELFRADRVVAALPGIAADPQALRAEGRVVSQGRQIVTAEAKVTDERGRVLAHGTSTVMTLGAAR